MSRVFNHDSDFVFSCQERYSSFDKGIGAKIEKGTTSLEELEVCKTIFTSAHVPYLPLPRSGGRCWLPHQGIKLFSHSIDISKYLVFNTHFRCG